MVSTGFRPGKIRAGENLRAIPVESMTKSPFPGMDPYLEHHWRDVLYHLPLAHPLPAIRIPLRYEDPDVVLELQPLIDQAYRNGRYERIDYSRPLTPPLPAPEAAWVAERLAARIPNS